MTSFAEMAREVEAALTGWPGYALFWSVIIFAASLELARPGSGKASHGKRLATNFGLGIANFAVLAVPFVSGIAIASYTASEGWGLLNQPSVPLPLAIIASFIVADLYGYTIHRRSHAWQPLWRLHRVHHSDPAIDLSTLFRVHPLTAIVLLPLLASVIVLAGLHPVGLLLHGLARLATMALGHANTTPGGRLEAMLATVLVTPGFHRRHHSAHRAETDSNYGEVFSVWDRIFRTNYRGETPVNRYGLGESYDSDSDDLLEQLRLPFDRSR